VPNTYSIVALVFYMFIMSSQYGEVHGNMFFLNGMSRLALLSDIDAEHIRVCAVFSAFSFGYSISLALLTRAHYKSIQC